MANKEELRKLKEAKLEKLKWEAYRVDPLFWLEDRLKEPRTNFAWSEIEGYKDHQWDGDKDPLAEAWKVLGNGYNQVRKGDVADFRYVGIESATGTSKTFWLARLVLWFLDCFPNSLVVTSAPKQDQLKIGLWSEIGMIAHKIRKIRPNAQLYKLRLAMDETQVKDLADDEMLTSNSWHAIGFVAGAGADEQSADRARGIHRENMLIIMEECTGIPIPVMTAFQNTSTGLKNFIVAVGNPSNEFDPLHQFCMQADVKEFRISAFDYPNIVLNKEMYSGAVTWASINSRTAVYGEGSPLWNAMVRGISPTQATDSLIKLEWVEQCIDLVFEEHELEGYNAAGVDVANSVAGDKAAVVWGKSNICMRVDEFYCRNATHLAYNVLYPDHVLAAEGYDDYGIPSIEDYDIEADCIGVDAVGVGVATVNGFLEKGYEVQALSGGPWDEAIPKEEIRNGGKTTHKRMYSFASLRSQMYWELREDLRKRKISLQIQDKTVLRELVKELCIPKFKADSANIEVERKDDIKKRLGGKSPNKMDALAYWNWVRKGYKISRWGFAAMSAGED